MATDNPKAGLGYAAEFQSSALPFVTSSTAPAAGSPVRFLFPKISRFIMVSNKDATVTNTLSFGFTRNGVIGNNKFVVGGGQTVEVEIRAKELWLQGESATPVFSLLAGLTNIDATMMPVLTGTLPSGSPGWSGVG